MVTRHWLLRLDWWLLGAAVALVGIGITAIQEVVDLVPGAGLVERQLAWVAIATVALIAATWLPYSCLIGLAYGSFALCILLLVAVGWSEPVNGAQRWLRIGSMSLQPSEFTKLAFVAALARYLVRGKGRLRLADLFGALALAAVPIVLILKQPDLGTALLFVPVLLVMLFCAGASAGHLALLLLAGLTALPGLWTVMTPVQRSRITAFLRQRDSGPVPREAGYQLFQSKRMIALGGVAGSQEAGEVYLPFAYTDFIFSVVGGRRGLAGTTATLGLLGMLLWRGLRLAARTPDAFGRLLLVGIVAMLATQGILNVAMTVGLAPIAGLTLPLLSYGGSSLLTCFITLGLLLNMGLKSSAWADLPAY